MGKQMFPENVKFFSEVFHDATYNPYTYLLIDLRNDTPEDLRLRTRILPEETLNGTFQPIVYKPRK